MAIINRENIRTLNDRISVKVDREDYYPEFEKVLKKFSKTANIPGFRKGMVPSGLIKKMHGQSFFTDEVIKSVEKELQEYIQKENLILIGNPLPLNTDVSSLDVNNPAEYQFDFEIGLQPEFEVSPIKEDFHFTRYKIKAEEKDIDEQVKRLQQKAGERKEKEEVSTEEDILKLHFQLTDAEGQPGEGEAKEEQIIVSYFIPALQKQLMGKKKGDTLNLPLSEAFEQKELDYIIKDWKLEEVENPGDRNYLITIDLVEEIIPRELTEEFYKEVYPTTEITTEEAFRDRIRQNEENYWEQEANKRLDQEIFEKLVHGTPIELPETFLKRWMRQEGTENPKTEAEVEESYSDFDHQMRWNLVSNKLIKDHEISVAPEELREALKQQLLGYFQGRGQLPDADSWIDSYVARMMQDEKTVNETYQRIITAKLFEWLREQANLEEKEITADEFTNLPHNHHHHEH